MFQSFDIVAADQVAPDLLRRTFGAAFADYLIGPFAIGPDAWPAFLARQGIDLALSRVALGPSTPLAFALVAPRPRRGRWRLATMGAIPSARGLGVASRLLDDVISRAAASGVSCVELEVFAANEKACGLYRSRGFQPSHALHGYEWSATAVSSVVLAGQIHEAAREEALAWLEAADKCIPDLPLQVTHYALASIPEPMRAWRLGSAQLVFSETADGPITIRSLIDQDARQRDALALINALLCQLPQRGARVPQLQRRDVGGDALAAAGFRALPLHQWLMRRQLA